eukprot:15345520-Ditylum_brightwellii.AAC.1
MMGIDRIAVPCSITCKNMRKNFQHGIGSNCFPIGVYYYRTPGIVSGYLVVFKIKRGDSISNPAIDLAATNAPIYLSIYLDMRQATLSLSYRPLLDLSSWRISSDSKDILDEIEAAILCEDADEDQIPMISDMRAYNCHGNNIESKF